MTIAPLDLPGIEAVLVAAVAQATRSGAECRRAARTGTEADRFVARSIRAVLGQYPDIRVVCEEDPASHDALSQLDHAFLVDPIDGSEGFDRGDPEFAHMVAFMSQGRPVAAAIACPGYGWLLSGNRSSGQLRLREISDAGDAASSARSLDAPSAAGCRAVISQSELTKPMLARLERLGVDSLMLADSAVAFCHLLLGNAELFVRLQPNREWDIAPGHALLAIQGGEILDLDGGPITYGKPGLRNAGFVAYSAECWCRRMAPCLPA